MATPTVWTPYFTICDLCDNPTQKFCKDCHLRLCDDCVSKHMGMLMFLMHEIIPFTLSKFNPYNVCEDTKLKSEFGERRKTGVQIPKLLDKARVIGTILPVVNALSHVTCVGGAKAWISGQDKSLKCIDIHGSVWNTITTVYNTLPNASSVTEQGELIYSDYQSRTVNIVRHGKTETLITTPQGWHPDKLCCTKSGEILVSMGSSVRNRSKIVRYQGNTMKQEIEKDHDGMPIYRGGAWPLFVAENNNGDICASDNNADQIVVVDKSGRVRFRYGGEGTGIKHLDPRNIVTDSLSQIIVAYYFDHCLHILDQNGQFLKCVDNCDLFHPFGLGVGSEGRLWIGLSDFSEIKLIQYMETT